MAANSARLTLSRQWELLKLLPSRAPGLSAAELLKKLQHAGHDTSKRTVERDLVDLSQVFPLRCNDKGTPYGWYWAPERAADLPGIALSEALTLRLVEGSIRPLIPEFMLESLAPHFAQARQKLQALSDENASARWIDKVVSVPPQLNMLAPEVALDQLTAVQSALLKDRQLNCRYYSAHKNQTTDLTLNPLGLVQRAQVTYLVATADPFTDIRLFALHRFEKSQVTSVSSQKPKGFLLQAYVDSGALQFGTAKPVQLDAWVDSSLARLLDETPISKDMTLTAAENGATLRATVNDSWELKWWALSHAGSIKVTAPVSLRETLIEHMQRGLTLHEMGNPE